MLPLLLILLGGGYWFYRNLSLSSSAESAAHAQMLRAGRRLAGIEPRAFRDDPPGRQRRAHRGAQRSPDRRGAPVPRPGRQNDASADVSLGKEPVGAFLDLPSHALRGEAGGAVDCWGKETPSGSTVRRTVQGILLTGVLR